MTAIRFIIIAATGLVAGEACAAPVSGSIPLPRERPTFKFDQHAKSESRAVRPMSATARVSALSSSEVFGASTLPAPGLIRDNVSVAPPNKIAPPATKIAQALPGPQFAFAASASTSPLDLAAVRRAIDLARHGRPAEATTVEGTITDPMARKVVEWVILRSDDADLDFPRYAAFIDANQSWPGIAFLRRRAEAALWQQQPNPRKVIEFFKTEPLTAKGRFALARALLAAGDRAGAQAALRQAWRTEAFSSDLEAQARAAFAGLITAEDDKARMDTRLDDEDNDAGLRTAQRLGANEVAIAKARIAVNDRSGKAKALLEAVPQAARRDAGYILSRSQWLRREGKIAEAGRLMLSAPHDPAQLGDPEPWWDERRVLARSLLDIGDAKSAYAVASGGAAPTNPIHRSEQQFTAGWIALRFLHEPAVAVVHFARVTEGMTNPTALARGYYWQGRAEEALAHEQNARAFYETAAHYPTAFYGQLARARLGMNTVTLSSPPELGTEHSRLEVVRALEILYAVDERDLAAIMAAELGEKATDVAALTAAAEITTRHNDARATMLIGKGALGRGLPLERYAFPDFGVPSYQQVGPTVERCVVYSIVRQESSFNPRAISSANALGLMQVTPAAGRDTAKRFNVSFDRQRLLTDVSYNAQLGTAEIGNDLAAWRGSYILAFVAYNAGPGRAREWIEQYGDPRNSRVDPIDWIERIPLKETRLYVQHVIENMEVYRVRFGGDSRLLIEADLHRGG